MEKKLSKTGKAVLPATDKNFAVVVISWRCHTRKIFYQSIQSKLKS
jgi:hypothetical protein